MSTKENLEHAIKYLEDKYETKEPDLKVKEEVVGSSLFNNPMIDAALKSMTSEQREEYQTFGKHMYGSVNFEDNKILSNAPVDMEEALAYVVEGLKSGLHPKDVSDDEVALLKAGYGEKWYEYFGYKEDELED